MGKSVVFLFIPLLYPLMRSAIVVYLVCRVRTSSGTFLQRGRDKIIRNIEKRIANFTFLPVGMLLSSCPLIYVFFVPFTDFSAFKFEGTAFMWTTMFT